MNCLACSVHAPDPQETLSESVWGCVLIGGRSTRMGRPKQLIRPNGRDERTWLEGIVAVLGQESEQVALAGGGDVPASLDCLTRVADAPGLAGPLAGILAVLRQFPQKSWLVVACDQPLVSREALQWLLAQRQADCLAVLPELWGDGRVEPLLAYYDRRCLPLLEAMAAAGRLRLGSLRGEAGVLSPRPPEGLRGAWRNINTPEELAAWSGSCDPPDPPTGAHAIQLDCL